MSRRLLERHIGSGRFSSIATVAKKVALHQTDSKKNNLRYPGNFNRTEIGESVRCVPP